ncbi:MAG: sugar phosphate nucleotidyltransferase [Candidatus Methanomethylicaceae archaeon]
MIVKKVVITAAGLGTRLLTATKEMPKEMLPLFCLGSNLELLMKPILQLVFEQLYGIGFREFCFIVGRDKRAIEDHFTPDYKYVDLLIKKGKVSKAKELEDFYNKIKYSTIVWINQPEPRGFGDAVLLAKPFIGNEAFLVHAGDTYIISEEDKHLRMLLSYYEKRKTYALLILKEVFDPSKLYGVADVDIKNSVIKVKKVVEKPKKPTTNLAIMPIYIFDPMIFKALEVTPLGVDNEIQLTDAIQKLIDWNMDVEAIKLELDDIRLDVGTPETYWEALSISFHYFSKKLKEHDKFLK